MRLEEKSVKIPLGNSLDSPGKTAVCGGVFGNVEMLLRAFRGGNATTCRFKSQRDFATHQAVSGINKRSGKNCSYQYKILLSWVHNGPLQTFCYRAKIRVITHGKCLKNKDEGIGKV